MDVKHHLSVQFEPSFNPDFPMANYVLNFSMPGTTESNLVKLYTLETFRNYGKLLSHKTHKDLRNRGFLK